MRSRRLRAYTRIRNRILLSVDLLLMAAACVGAMALRTEDFQAVLAFAPSELIYFLTAAGIRISIYVASGLYSVYWAYASTQELQILIRSVVLSTLAVLAAFFGILLPLDLVESGFPRSVPIIESILTLLLVGGVRLSIRLVYSLTASPKATGTLKPVLIAGAGVAGVMVAKELSTNPQLGYYPIGYIDDDPRKIGSMIQGIKVLGSLSRLPSICRERKVSMIVIAMPTAPGRVIRQVMHSSRECGVPSQTVPGIFEILRGSARVDQFRSIQLEDLLRRGTIKTDTKLMTSALRGTRIMVTGAGGSIGSELCRQLKEFGPAELILLGHGENSIFSIAKELGEVPRHDLRIHSVIADIRDPYRMDQVLGLLKPDIVFHAAAHKHVPLMEDNIPDAVTNNVLGTRVVLDACVTHGVSRFVMISTDKAVNPSSTMGVTKRIAELLVQEVARRTKRAFVTVRFGNVLGSRGSVVPILKRQIELGGPVTITHPEVRRFFMTIPEAVQLVLQAGVMGDGGEVFVLDMGEQIKVADLARDLIRLSGLEEGKDIDIVFTGLRPGEKMYEELFYDSDRVDRTPHEKVMVCLNDGHDLFNGKDLGAGNPFSEDVTKLVHACRNGSIGHVDELFKRLVPQYKRT